MAGITSEKYCLYHHLPPNPSERLLIFSRRTKLRGLGEFYYHIPEIQSEFTSGMFPAKLRRQDFDFPLKCSSVTFFAIETLVFKRWFNSLNWSWISILQISLNIMFTESMVSRFNFPQFESSHSFIGSIVLPTKLNIKRMRRFRPQAEENNSRNFDINRMEISGGTFRSSELEFSTIF